MKILSSYKFFFENFPNWQWTVLFLFIQNNRSKFIKQTKQFILSKLLKPIHSTITCDLTHFNSYTVMPSIYKIMKCIIANSPLHFLPEQAPPIINLTVLTNSNTLWEHWEHSTATLFHAAQGRRIRSVITIFSPKNELMW